MNLFSRFTLFHRREDRNYADPAPVSEAEANALQSALQQSYAVPEISSALRQRVADMAADYERQFVMQKQRGVRLRFGFALGGAALFCFACVAMMSLFIRVYDIPSAAMEPTLLGSEVMELTAQGPNGVIYYTNSAHDRVLVNRQSYRWSAPKFGDIVVFRAPRQADAEHRFTGMQVENVLIKRIIGLPGDTIEVKAGHVYRNDEPLNEFQNPKWPYSIKEPMDLDLETQFNFATSWRGGPVKLKSGQYWVMGDNRNDSNDSRYWGPLERSRIIGKVTHILYPWNRFRALP